MTKDQSLVLERARVIVVKLRRFEEVCKDTGLKQLGGVCWDVAAELEYQIKLECAGSNLPENWRDVVKVRLLKNAKKEK